LGYGQQKHRALLFAVDDYQHMTDLQNPVKNARDIARELENRYGFDAEVVTNPTFEDIEQKIMAYQQAYRRGTYAQDGQLLIFFSGHGVRRGKNGYFMPKDGDPDRPYTKGLEYDFWRSEIDAIDCKHILVAIDACHSITFDPNWENKPDRLFKRPGEQYVDQTLLNHQAYRARLFYTSDATGNETPDRSTFARQLLEGLRTHQSATGYLTSSELFASYMLKAAPTPGGGDFGNDEPGSCFLFFGENSGGGDPEEERFWKLAQQQNTREAYAFYLQLYPDGQYSQEAKRAMQAFPQPFTSAPAEKPIQTDELPAMVFVEGGTFQMGSTEGDSDEKPVHSVTVSDFYIGRFEVTVEAFSEFVQATDYRTDAEKKGGSYLWENSEWTLKAGINWRFDAAGKQRPASEYNHPVLHVSWNDAVAYCNWLSQQHRYEPVYTINGDQVTANWDADGYRLPTEAEWEFAARSRGKNYKYAWGNDQPNGNIADQTTKQTYDGWTIWEGYTDGYVHTAPVGRFEQGDLGLSDMTGNVWEWCWDWYDSDYYDNSPSRNPHGPSTGSGRVLRGGSWYIRPANLRCAYRGNSSPDSRSLDIGFRLTRAGS
jgi:formylglycine-generating enzyme required for sulfatase activity